MRFQLNCGNLDDAGLSMFDISVDTYQGNVQLREFVDSQDDIERAAQIVQRVQGVRTVETICSLKAPDYPD